jgi:hypothetical protein
MLSDEEAARLSGARLISGDGEELGAVAEVLTHAADNRAAWAGVEAEDGLAVVPLDGAALDGERLTVRYAAELIRSAPAFDGPQLDAAAAEALYAHYGITDAVLRDDSGFATEQGVRGNASPAARDPRAGGADDAAQGHP